ncbi:KCNK18 [Cordylochernes scorpioides]|uniref:KCNK18 n=1 Tax=Cordylochernes scorpioides TaxID=51811 RepID=A0ABY6KSD1_9ARAC|nr:KCNK18 [Cordylochernes scorpioides]
MGGSYPECLSGGARMDEEVAHHLHHLPPPPPPHDVASSHSGTSCCTRRLAGCLFSHAGLCFVVVGYGILGAFTFRALEGPHEASRAARVRAMRAETVRKLWNLTAELNVLYRDNWTRLATDELQRFQTDLLHALRREGYDGVQDHQPGHWSLCGAFFYSLTIITTVGYGNVAPKTQWGKVITILYAILGIPLMLLYLTSMGNLLARWFRSIYAWLSCRRRRREYKGPALHENHIGISPVSTGGMHKVTVPIPLCVLVILGYIAAGAVLFSFWEGWGLLDGSYFCFVTLSTIGFGDLGARHDPRAQLACSVYLLTGMALIAMCFNLMQEEVVYKIRRGQTDDIT